MEGVVVVGVVVVGVVVVVGDMMDDGGGGPTGLGSPGLDMDNDDGERVSEWGPRGTTRHGYDGGCAGGRAGTRAGTRVCGTYGPSTRARDSGGRGG